MSVLDKLHELDARLLVAGERLKRERERGGNGLIVQRGVCDRMLDERLVLMAERDHVIEALG